MTITQDAWISMGGASNCDLERKSYFARLLPFLGINLSKLTVGAYAWTWGFVLMHGQSCWITYDTWMHSPGGDSCTMNALILSGIMASLGLLLTLFCAEFVLMEKEKRTTRLTYAILFLSVSISDASWSYFNWISYSIANSVDNISSNNEAEQEGVTIQVIPASLIWTSLLGFGLNAIFFYVLHNSATFAIIKWTQTKQANIWYCDWPFALLVFGSYYGFGPVAVYLNLAYDSTSDSGVALLNALGTFLGALLIAIFVYFLPAWVWLPPARAHDKNDQQNSLSSDNTVELRDSLQSITSQTAQQQRQVQSMRQTSTSDKAKLLVSGTTENPLNPGSALNTALLTNTDSSKL